MTSDVTGSNGGGEMVPEIVNSAVELEVVMVVLDGNSSKDRKHYRRSDKRRSGTEGGEWSRNGRRGDTDGDCTGDSRGEVDVLV